MSRAKMKIKKGDQVVVLAGKNKGARGEVLKAIPEESRLIVQGVNMVKRHSRASQSGPGGLVQKEATIHVSNVALIDPKNDTATRVGYTVLKDGKKVRVARKSGETIE